MTDSESSESQNDLLESITLGAVIFAAGKFSQNVFGLLSNYLLTRTLGVELYGVFSYGQTLLNIITTLAQFGTAESIMRFIPEVTDGDSRNGILTLAYATILTGSALAAVTLYVAAPFVNSHTLQNPVFTKALRVFAVIIPFRTLANVISSTFRGLELPKFQIGIKNVLIPATRFLTIGVAVFVGYSLIGIVAALAVGGVLVSLVALGFLRSRTSYAPTRPASWSQTRRFYEFSVPLALTSAGSVMNSRIDILMIGFFLTDDAVGIYSVAVLVSSFIGMPLTAINQLFPSIASRLYQNGNHGQLDTVYSIVTRWGFSASLCLGVGGFVYSSEILAVFGAEFIAGTTVLWLFIAAQLARTVVGPSGFMLMMSDHQYVVMANRWVLGLLNIVLNLTLVTRFGLLGVAFASAFSLALVNVVRVVEVYYLEGFVPYSREYLKPLVASLTMAVSMFGAKFALSELALLVVGGTVGVAVYLLTLFALGIDEDDYEFLMRMASSVGSSGGTWAD